MMTDLCERPPRSLGPEHSRQRQAAQGKAADLKERSPGDAIAIPMTRTEKG